MIQRSINARHGYVCPAPPCGGGLSGWGAGAVVVAFLHLLSFSVIFTIFLVNLLDHDPTIHHRPQWVWVTRSPLWGWAVGLVCGWGGGGFPSSSFIFVHFHIISPEFGGS